MQEDIKIFLNAIISMVTGSTDRKMTKLRNYNIIAA